MAIRDSYETRIHSSKMCSVCCSSCLLRVSAGGVSTQEGVCPGRMYAQGVCTHGMCAQGVSAKEVSAKEACLPRGWVSVQGGLSAQGGVCPEGVYAQGGVYQTPPCEQNDRCWSKHYLAATTLRTVITTSSSACGYQTWFTLRKNLDSFKRAVNSFSIAGAVKGEIWFAKRPILCSILGGICTVSCYCSLLSIMAVSIDRYVHICRSQACLNTCV